MPCLVGQKIKMVRCHSNDGGIIGLNEIGCFDKPEIWGTVYHYMGEVGCVINVNIDFL